MTAISLVISDVDGTLVTSDKRLTEAARKAVAQLHARGIAFTIISSRPPFGMRMLVEPLGLGMPMGAFNGGMLVNPDLTVIERQIIGRAAAAAAIDTLQQAGVGVWVYTDALWLASDPHGDYVDHEIRTILTDPTIIERFDDYLDGAIKIVGVSRDSDRLTACEDQMRQSLNGKASVVRSQSYYLDITPLTTNKGTVVTALAKQLGLSRAEIATLGDMENDVSMFRESGFSVAMGNAKPAVQSQASATTRSNEEDGFAHAIEHLILPRCR